MATIADLKVAFSADTKKLQDGIKNAGQTVKNSGKHIETAFGAKGTQAIGSTTSAVINFNRVIQDAPYGLIGIANNIDPLVQSFQGLKASTGSTMGALKSLLTSAFTGPGALITVTSLATTGLLLLSRRMSGAGEAGKKAKAGVEAFTGALEDQIKAINALAYGDSTQDQLKAAENQKRIYESSLAELEKMRDVNQEIDFKTAIAGGNTTALLMAGINKLFGTSINQEEQQKIVTDAINGIKEKILETEGKILGLRLTDNSELNKTLSLEERRLTIAKALEDITGKKTRREQEATQIKVEPLLKNFGGESLKKFLVDNYKVTEEKFVPALEKVNTQFGNITARQAAMIPFQEKLNNQFMSFMEIGTMASNILVSGFANLVQSGQDFADVLKNIGRMLASTALQIALKAFLTGGLGFAGDGFFGKQGGLLGTLGGILFPGASASGMALMNPVPALNGQNITVGGQFVLKGTDLVGSITKTQNSVLR